MLRLVLAGIVGIVIGLAPGFALGIFFYPYIFLAGIVASEAVPEGASGKIIAMGDFIHVNTVDPVHWGQGKVSVYEGLVHLENDFKVGPGPAFHVYLVPKAEVRAESDVRDSMFVDLGRLKAFEGSQNYQIPKGVNLPDYGSIVIWCEHFGVLISPATLKASAS